MDKLMLGLFSSKAEVGFYTYSEQIISIPRSFISALGTVMLPRAANLIQNGKERENISLLNRSMQLAMLICMASTFGVISISNVFIPWYYGELFRRCVLFTILLSPTVIFAGWNNVIRTQFVIPRSLDNIYLVTVSTGALTNLLLNLVLIPHFDGTGAIIATVFAEFSVCFAQFLLLKKKLSYKPFLGDAFVFLLFGVIMLAALLFIPELFKIKIIEIIFRIFLGALIFVGLSFVYLYSFKKDYFYFDYIKLVSRKFSKTK